MATDASGNIYICGKFYADSISFGSTVLINANSAFATPDIFLAKYNSAGTVLWAKRAGGTNQDIANSVAVDAAGNVFICGYFQSDTIVFGTTSLVNVGTGHDYFVAKYDAAGNVLWAKDAGGSGYEHANGVATDASGNAIITGYFSSASFSIGTTTLTNAGNWDPFVAKYDASGNVLWAKWANGLYLDQANAVTTDAAGNIYITGYFGSNSLMFGTTSISHTGPTTSYDIFTAKYNSAGTFQWARAAGGSPSEVSYAIDTDVSGNVYVSGYYESATLTFGTSTLTNAGGGDILVLKYNSEGTEIKALGIGGSGNEAAVSINVAADGKIFLAGWYQLANLTVGSTTLTNAGGTDGFLIKLDTTGTPLWATNAGYDLNDQATAVAVDAFGNIFLTGFYQSYQIYFDSFILQNSVANGGSSDIFLGKMNSPSVSISESGNQENSIGIFPNPFTNELTVTGTKANEEIIIFDVTGKEILRVKTFDHETKINTEHILPGFYMLHFPERNNTSNFKLNKF
jgi:hypothetical protein